MLPVELLGNNSEEANGFVIFFPAILTFQFPLTRALLKSSVVILVFHGNFCQLALKPA